MKTAVFAAAALALACAACNNANKLYPVSGNVLYKGRPAAGAYVTFVRKVGDPLQEQTMMGVVQENGTFTIDSGVLGKGAPAGEYAVLIHWPQGPNRNRLPGQRVPDRLKGRYSDPKNPLFHAVVKPGANNLLPFEVSD